MQDAERLLGALLGGGLSGRSSKQAMRGLGGGLGKGLGRVVTSPQGLTILGGIAIAAIEHFRGAKQGASAPQSQPQPQSPPPMPTSPVSMTPPPLPPAATSTGPGERASLLVRAMLAAARADGTIDETERARITSRLGEEGVSDEDSRWLEAELARPVDLDGLLREVDSPVAAAEVYLVSLLSIDADTTAERAYLALLAARLGLDDATVGRLQADVDTLRQTDSGTDATN